MAKILVIENDPVWAAVVEDRLVVAGYEVVLFDEAVPGISAAAEEGVDLAIVAMELPIVSGRQVIRTLRSERETRRLPILALVRGGESAARLEALRAGADDALERPCEPEELVLRVENLLGRGAAEPPLQGELEGDGLAELVAHLEDARKSGMLVVRGPKGSGRVQIARGQAVSARFEGLEGLAAFLATLGLKAGTFQFVNEAETEAPAKGERMALRMALLQAAWFEDQLAELGAHLPATGVPLRPTAAQKLPRIEGEFENLPYRRIYDRILDQPGVRLFDLLADRMEAPQAVRLTVASLIGQGIVATGETQAESPQPTTTEIASTVVVEVAAADLAAAAREAGHEPERIDYAILVEEGLEKAALAMLAAGPGSLKHPGLVRLREEFSARSAGRVDFDTFAGELVLHVLSISEEAIETCEGLLGHCGGMMLWLERAEPRPAVEGLVQAVEKRAGKTLGLVVAGSPEGRETAAELIGGAASWHVSSYAPQSLLGALRLFHPEQWD